jgi:NAD(P)H dehydrogenase (quinone)
MKKVLVVYCSLSGNTKAAAEAVAEGARAAGAEVSVKTAEEAQRQDLLECDAVALGSYDVFDCMAGDLQLFLDRAAKLRTEDAAGKPYGAFLTYGDTGRAITSIEAMAEALQFKRAAASVRVKGFPDPLGTADLKALGARLAKSAG